MKLKYFKLTFVLLTVTVLVACNRVGSKQADMPVDETMLADDSIPHYKTCDGVDVYCLRDVQSEMKAELFKGSFDDRLLDSLMPSGSTPSAINTFLVNDGENVVLVDAGLGPDKGGMMLAKLHSLDVRPEQVTAVCLTHLHTDHIGGLLNGDDAIFPDATIYLSVDEFDAWSDNGPMAAHNELWKKVLASYALHMQPVTDGDTILGGLVVVHLAPGHTPGHTVYQVGNCLFSGDLVHAQDLQIAHPQFCARYDNDRAAATATRLKWLDYAKKQHLRLCDAHCYDSFMLIR